MVNTKYIHIYNVILNNAVTKLVTILTKCFFSMSEPSRLKTFFIALGSVVVLLLNSIEQEIVVIKFLIEIMVLMPFQLFLILFQLLSKYFV